MLSLLDKCCRKCTHSKENPCPDYIECRVKGPLCHDDQKCRDDREKRIEGLKYGVNGSKVRVPLTSCTLATGAEEVYNKVKEYVSAKGLKTEVTISGCFGLDYLDPWLEVVMKGYPAAIYVKVKPEEVPKILDEYFEKRDVSNAFALRCRSGSAKGEERVPLLHEIDVWKKQYKWVSRNCGFVNSESLEEYILSGGYGGLSRALKMKPEHVIETIMKSGLRGRGGAGFPTGLKWKITMDQPGNPKYVVANADEGDPGAFMNRLLAESDPFRIIEGLTIAGYSIGASRGYVFVRAEKPLMASRLEKAVKEARRYGLLGENILGSGFSFDIDIILSAGAFVCGEETAMLSAIEGNRAWPRQRPPLSGSNGVMGAAYSHK